MAAEPVGIEGVPRPHDARHLEPGVRLCGPRPQAHRQSLAHAQDQGAGQGVANDDGDDGRFAGWREAGAETTPWRLVVVNPHSGERQAFTEVEQLTIFLEDQLRELETQKEDRYQDIGGQNDQKASQ